MSLQKQTLFEYIIAIKAYCDFILSNDDVFGETFYLNEDKKPVFKFSSEKKNYSVSKINNDPMFVKMIQELTF